MCTGSMFPLASTTSGVSKNRFSEIKISQGQYSETPSALSLMPSWSIELN